MTWPLGVTVAPLIRPEKPQLCPRPAADLIKKRRKIRYLDTNRRVREGTGAEPFKVPRPAWNALFSLAFCCGRERCCLQTFAVYGAPLATGTLLAQICVSAALPVPICIDRHNSATDMQARCRRVRTGMSANCAKARHSRCRPMTSPRRGARKHLCKTLEQRLALYPHLRRDPNWLSIEQLFYCTRDQANVHFGA